MIQSLDDAWRWYLSARRTATILRRIGTKHWDEFPRNGGLGRDDQLNQLDSTEVVEASDLFLREIDDLCVLFLFSVFEAKFRERALADVEKELPATIKHAALRDAVKNMRDGIEKGSINRVLEPYKSIDHELVEEVNQVRRYRNGVAHGRRR